MKKIHLAVIIGICGIVLVAGIIIAFFPGAGQPGTNADRPVLKVALYPYFEDVNGDAHATTINLLKERYHALYPDDELEIFISDDYNTYFVDRRNYSSVFGPGGPDIIEVEQTLLDNLRQDGYIQPFVPGSPATVQMLKDNRVHVVDPYENIGIVDNKVYFVPTWLCSHYTFVRNPPGTAPESGDFSSTGMLPDLYLSAYASTYGSDPVRLNEAVGNAVNGSPDSEVTGWLSKRFMACTNTTGENRCLNGYYAEDNGVGDFVSGNTDRHVGFSEILYTIISKSPKGRENNLTISGTVYGKGTYPSLAWVDGFVMNNHTSQEKMGQAIRFIDFYNSPDVKAILALSRDARNQNERVPRYLLPASEDFYLLPEVSSDPYYQQLYPVIQTMTPFPTGGLRGNMRAVYCNVTSALHKNGMDVTCPTSECTCTPGTAIPA